MLERPQGLAFTKTWLRDNFKVGIYCLINPLLNASAKNKGQYFLTVGVFISDKNFLVSVVYKTAKVIGKLFAHKLGLHLLEMIVNLT